MNSTTHSPNAIACRLRAIEAAATNGHTTEAASLAGDYARHVFFGALEGMTAAEVTQFPKAADLVRERLAGARAFYQYTRSGA